VLGAVDALEATREDSVATSLQSGEMSSNADTSRTTAVKNASKVFDCSNLQWVRVIWQTRKCTAGGRITRRKLDSESKRLPTQDAWVVGGARPPVAFPEASRKVYSDHSTQQKVRRDSEGPGRGRLCCLPWWDVVGNAGASW
jgi:hypothetical protein